MTMRKAAVGTVRPEVPGIGRGPLLPVTKPVAAYVDGEIEGLIVRPLTIRHDSRGWLVELFRHDELVSERWPRMAYASMTLPGVTRGPHEHRDQTDGFGFFGPSDFRVYAWDTRTGSPTFGNRTTLMVGESHPTALWIPPGVVHAYRNIGVVPGLVFNAPNRLYAGWERAEPVDETRHEDVDPSIFPMDD
ncbi:MAG TPA: dTDP-4-dehydrorhamnose 3,5-epimerase family protein [Isosphaeraceae bacterium]|jgi:dTDP-4-dehydrorhamnose 3,5-epimerase|nr:dTDP-4-dehydrorhamnose 3,5-epimerase family protein [Isosphaeraceae bacterium]